MKYISKNAIIQFIKFGIVGFSNTVIAYVIYALLVYFKLHYILANIIAFIISVLNSFFWNNKYVFKNEVTSKRDILHSLIKTYISYSFTGVFLGNALIFLFVDVLHISKYLAPFFGLVITVPLNFFMNKKWAFKPIKDVDKQQNDEQTVDIRDSINSQS